MAERLFKPEIRPRPIWLRITPICATAMRSAGMIGGQRRDGAGYPRADVEEAFAIGRRDLAGACPRTRG
jgi:hypothetical protein